MDSTDKKRFHGEFRKSDRRNGHPRHTHSSKSDKKTDFKLYSGLPITGSLTKTLEAPLGGMTCCVFDIETTGGNPEKNGITEICAFRVENGQIKDRFYSMVNPQIPIPPIVRRMTGINNRMVRHEPLIQEVMPRFVDFIGDDILVSHNTIGDLKFLRYFARETTSKTLGNFFLCTHLLTEKLLPEAPDKSLNGAADYLNIDFDGDAHRAEADAKMTLLVFEALRKLLIKKNITLVKDGIRFQEDLESAIRLGWEISKENIAQVEPKPGVLRFFDQHQNDLFITSSFNCKKNLQALQKRDLLPRQLLRTLLKSHQVQAEYQPHIFLAMLHEAKVAGDQNLRVSPCSFHQRSIFCYCLSRENGGDFSLSVDIPDARTLYAFGPVFDKKEAGQLLKNIASAVSGRSGRKGFYFESQWLSHILAFFESPQKPSLRKKLAIWLDPRFLFSSKWRQEKIQEIRASGQLSELFPGKIDFHNLFENHGIFIIEPGNTQESGFQLIPIVGSVPLDGGITLEKDWKNWLYKETEGLRFRNSLIEKANQFQKAKEVSTWESLQRNASLWMLYNKKGKLPHGSWFLPLSELNSDG